MEASKMMKLGVYGDVNLTDILFKEFVLGNKENLTENATKLVDSIKDFLKNSSEPMDFANTTQLNLIGIYFSEAFSHYAAQPCRDLFVSIKFQGKTLYWNDFDTSVGPWYTNTDYGTCCFVSPHLNMNPIDWSLGDIKIFHELKAEAKHGESNGLDLILNAEQFNYDFNHESIDSNGGGFKLTLHDHRDKPIIRYSSQLIHTGTETQINVKPVVTYTTDHAKSLTYERRGCYTKREVNLTYLLYDKGYHYNMNNCLLNEGIRGYFHNLYPFMRFV